MIDFKLPYSSQFNEASTRLYSVSWDKILSFNSQDLVYYFSYELLFFLLAEVFVGPVYGVCFMYVFMNIQVGTF